MIVDFVLMDVQMMEVDALEGMKETIRRSPNIVLNVEWTGYTHYPDGFQARKYAIVDFFVELGFNFYEMSGWRRDCGPENLVKRTA